MFSDCQKPFIVLFQRKTFADLPEHVFGPVEFFPKIFVKKEFSKEIETLSKDFVEIYNQALQAEECNLSEICGPGYRKSLEFLIKDFCIHEKPGDASTIKKKFLGDCIKD